MSSPCEHRQCRSCSPNIHIHYPHSCAGGVWESLSSGKKSKAACSFFSLSFIFYLLGLLFRCFWRAWDELFCWFCFTVLFVPLVTAQLRVSWWLFANSSCNSCWKMSVGAEPGSPCSSPANFHRHFSHPRPPAQAWRQWRSSLCYKIPEEQDRSVIMALLSFFSSSNPSSALFFPSDLSFCFLLLHQPWQDPCSLCCCSSLPCFSLRQLGHHKSIPTPLPCKLYFFFSLNTHENSSCQASCFLIV